ncbi:PspC domain-containing protein [Acinetobacter haemolyticus]|uniref:PspC domain-containing protein n=1 Tax=Acinetobacter haemolyticus TaxID=29430 RepID=UPI000D69B602|nr:PspC domain-containing protein [Acinetobacter haemolyticus]NAS01493.1 PspC domain-containing protein [Acinetobacter haemolyticus]QHI30705.1 PspC domain-containing protein [Acinetobacter haemolyticus]QHI31496.1 PspC domain-containing protein [Acinetobacter haemolyticus]
MTTSGLYRSNQKSMIAGVMGGIAERFGWNVNLLRLIFVVISIMSAAFPGILVYLILWLVIPKKQDTQTAQVQGYQQPVKTIYDEKNINR